MHTDEVKGKYETSALTREDIDLILGSLQYTRRNFEKCQDYPSHEFKQQRIAEVDGVTNKLRQMRKGKE